MLSSQRKARHRHQQQDRLRQDWQQLRVGNPRSKLEGSPPRRKVPRLIQGRAQPGEQSLRQMLEA